MKLKKAHSFFAFSLLAAATIALSACAGGGGDDADIVVPKKYLPADDPTSEVTITFWHCLGHNKRMNLQAIADAFNAKYAGKYKIYDLEKSKLGGDYGALASAAKTKIAGHEVPALCMGYPDTFSSYMTDDIDRSNLYCLDGFIEDETYGYSEKERADFVKSFYDEGNNYQFPGVWSMPMYKSTEIMYYNANFFAGANPWSLHKLSANTEFVSKYEALNNKGKYATDDELADFKAFAKGVGAYTYEVPVTWDEMIATSKQILKDRETEQQTSDFYAMGYDSDANMFITQFAQRGIDYTVNNAESRRDPEKHYLFKNDKAKEFLTEIVQLVKDKVLITKGRLGDSKYTNELFNNLECAFTIGSTGGSSYNISEDFAVRLAPVPAVDAAHPTYIQQGPSICFFDNNNDYIHKGAWLFYKMLAETEYNTRLALENSYDPIRHSCFETDDYKNHIAQHDVAMEFDIPYHTKDLRQYYMTSPVFPGSDRARDEIGSLIKYAINQNLGVDGAINKAYNICTQ